MTIPNILTCIRLGLMPVFVYVYFLPGEEASWWAMGILAVSFLTDVLDGYIARKFNQISDLGKILDPIADKLMQVTVLVCLMMQHHYVMWAVIFVFVKELLLGIGALIARSKGASSQSSIFAGKLACFVSVLVSLILLFPFPQPLPDTLVLVLLLMLVAFNAYALAAYIVRFFKIVKDKE